MCVCVCVCVCVYHLFIHSSVDGHLHCFHGLIIINSAAMNTGVCVSFRIMALSGYVPSRGIAGSYHRFIPSCFFFFNKFPYCSP